MRRVTVGRDGKMTRHPPDPRRLPRKRTPPAPTRAPRLVAHHEPDQEWKPRKEHAPCCVAQRDELGRLPIGYCGPTCVRRP